MKIIFQSIRIFILMTLLTGALYPLAVTGLAQALFHRQANGSLIEKNGQIAGSSLLAQKFQSPKYFWPRPSAADYATVASGASNQGPTSDALKSIVAKRDSEFRAANHLPQEQPVPSEMVFASGSGLDPDISPEAAQLQVARIAKERGIDEGKLKQLVAEYSKQPQMGILGEARVNVLALNLALDSI